MAAYSIKTTKAAPFRDLEKGRYNWYFSTSSEAYFKGLMSGTGNGLFEPDTNMTRGMVANVLYRMSGSPKVTFKKKFIDVNSGLWYSNAITWCSNNGVVNGYSNGKFGPDDNITREQMAAMCYNYAKYRAGRKPSATTSITKYKDYKNVTKNIQEAMRWAVATGIISGTTDEYLKPTSKATRAECAKMLLQLSKIVK